MRALILTGLPSYARASLQLFAEQIVAGPDWPDAQTRDGCWLSLRTPAGEFDLAEVLGKIPAYQRPDAVICLGDATWRAQPRNLRVFPGFKVLVLADDLAGQPGLQGVFRYVGLESFDRVMFRRDERDLRRVLAGLSTPPFAGLTEADAAIPDPPANLQAC